MRWASMRSMDVSNGEGVGVALFVQGCNFRCHNCFNPKTWDFNGGKEWTEKTKQEFLKLIDRPYIKRVSILGGEPLAENNLDEVLKLTEESRDLFPEKTIWLYTGYRTIGISGDLFMFSPNFVSKQVLNKDELIQSLHNDKQRSKIATLCNVIIDGQYIDSKRDITLKWRGSSNQRVIDVQKSLQKGEVVLWCN